jgi:hydroxymethylbilane synthase
LLAAAGVERLRAEGALAQELAGIEIVRLDPERFVPAPAQGALAVQCRRADEHVREALQALDHAPSHAAVTAERTALALAEGGCDIAFGAYCREDGAGHLLVAMHEHAGVVSIARVRGAEPRALGEAAWAEVSAAEAAR